MKLKTQAYLLSTVILAALLVLTATGLWTLRAASDMDNKARVTELFKSAYSILTEVEKMTIDGTLEEEQAKQLATRLLRNNIYKDNIFYKSEGSLVMRHSDYTIVDGNFFIGIENKLARRFHAQGAVKGKWAMAC